MRIIGLDPGLRRTGWGVIEAERGHLRFVAAGTVTSTSSRGLAERLVELQTGLTDVLQDQQPAVAAVEETFVNMNPRSTLKLGMARGVVLALPAAHGLPVFEYSANQIKKTVVGVGHADKQQVEAMVKYFLPRAQISGPDAADALAIAICHAHQNQVSQLKEAIACQP